MTKHHWIGRKPDPGKYFGFVYLITNKLNGRMYVGKRQYWSYKKRKKVRQTAWQYYTSSSKYVNEDIKESGIGSFEFKILKNYKTRGGLVYGEVNQQHKRDVLVRPHPDGRLYYNAQIGAIKFIPKEW